MSEHEHQPQFRRLRKLLTLKRHEVPPPGYFDNFSREVMARIKAGETGQAEGLAFEMPWLFRLVQAFEAKPAFAGGFASVLCMVLLAGIVFAERAPEISAQPILQTASSANSLGISDSPIAMNSSSGMETGFVSSTNPVFSAQTVPALYGSPIPSPQAVNVSFFKN
jgi:hypothetical protein